MKAFLLLAVLFTEGLLARGAEVHSLDGAWHIAKDPQNTGRQQNWFRGGPVRGAIICKVPDILETTFPGYDGVVWYWKTFNGDATGSNERVLIKFHAADYLVNVWLNGVPIGGHEGGETPFSLDATAAQRGGENRLVVRLLNPGSTPIDGITLNETPRSIKFAPMLTGRFWNCGGLWQSVELLRVPSVRVADVFADGRLSDSRLVVTVALRNDSRSRIPGRLSLELAPADGGAPILTHEQAVAAEAGDAKVELSLPVRDVRAWTPDDPYLYRLTARLDTAGGTDARAVRCGFRRLAFEDGYFRLNGKRIYLKSAHTTGHFPIGQHMAHDPELMRRELILAKTMGFNMIRTIGKMLLPTQLDLCDELGLMVYEESYASWGSAGPWGVPKVSAEAPWTEANVAAMGPRFDSAVREMILRDRSHPSIVMWGVLNETRNNPLFRHGVRMLPMIRSFDNSRLVMLNSGRDDGQWSVGSLSNPNEVEWRHVFGAEAPGAQGVDVKQKYEYRLGAGDVHRYAFRPLTEEVLHWFRTYGPGTGNVFLSEFGNGSQIDPVRMTRFFEEKGAQAGLDDAKFYRSIYEHLEDDWKCWGLDGVFSSPSEMIAAGERIHSEQRRIAINAVRSNARIVGFNVTGLSDQCNEGEGLLTLLREPKSGVMEAMADALAPVRWSVFAEPVHLYRGCPVHVEALLATEDVLAPGDYPVRLKITGPAGIAYEKASSLRIPDPRSSPEPPLVFPAFKEDVPMNGPAGTYQVTVLFDKGAAAVGRQTVFLGDPASLSKLAIPEVRIWNGDEDLARWLAARGIAESRFDPARTPARREVILIGGVDAGAPKDRAAYRSLVTQVARGGTAVFLSPGALLDKDRSLAFLPFTQRGRLEQSGSAYWGRDDIVKPHDIFAGLPSRTLMDLFYYRDIVPDQSFTDFDPAAEVVVPCFAAGIPIKQARPGYWSGANLLILPFGEGKFVLTTLRLLPNLGRHPAADRIVLNLLSYASADVGKPPAPTPVDFDSRLRAIDYPR